MPGKTISEKILSMKSGRNARAGDLVICAVDYAMATDGSAPMAIDYFEQMGGDALFDPQRIVFVMDHYSSNAHEATMTLQQKMRDFARKHDIFIHEIGEGISHQLMLETRQIQIKWKFHGGKCFMRRFCLLVVLATGIAMLVSGGLAQQAPTAGPYKLLKRAKVGGEGGFDYIF